MIYLIVAKALIVDPAGGFGRGVRLPTLVLAPDLCAALPAETLGRRSPACEGTGAWWAAAVLPSFLASFSCCAPTVLVLLGAGAAGAVVSVCSGRPRWIGEHPRPPRRSEGRDSRRGLRSRVAAPRAFTRCYTCNDYL